MSFASDFPGPIHVLHKDNTQQLNFIHQVHIYLNNTLDGLCGILLNRRLSKMLIQLRRFK